MRFRLLEIALIASGIILPASHASGADQCGKTVQTFWRLDPSSKKLDFKSLRRHDETICDPEKLLNQNGVAELLDQRKQVIRRVPIYVQTAIYGDVESGRKLSPVIASPAQIDFQLKFADTSTFQKASAMKIILDGKTFGPANF